MLNFKPTKKENRTTTLQSLYAAAVLMTTNDKETFIRAYRAAMHDNNGASIWFYVNKPKRGNK